MSFLVYIFAVKFLTANIMKSKLEALRYHFRNKSNVRLWLSDDGEVINSNICTLNPIDLTLISDLHLVVNTYMADLWVYPRLRFFNTGKI